jgi:hypothetical protein
VRLIRVAAETAILHDFDVWQQGRQRARHSRFGGPTLATDQHPTDAGINSVQDQGATHALLTDNSSKGINSWHKYSGGHYNVFLDRTKKSPAQRSGIPGYIRYTRFI